ncbi:MAG: acetylxylan esterase [Armatimonadetes bacterium]|nr:acetylxylan esterase [Armatimonadota bacterium]
MKETSMVSQVAGKALLRAWLLAFASLFLLFAVSLAAEEQNPRHETDVLKDAQEKKTMLEKYFERMTPLGHLKCNSKREWDKRRLEIRKQVLQAIGLDPLPEQIPLNVQYGGILDKGDYVVKRVYWQTWPKVYASGYLYLPKKPGKHPVILNPHGHWGNGAREDLVQTRCIVHAKRGYVALAVDSQHVGHKWFLSGFTSIALQAWNNMRALDFLETLPEADMTRVGCTGASGGGIQTMWMMALDDRITAAVPVVGPSFFRHILSPDFGHCSCNWATDLLECADEQHLLGIFVPKPVLFLTVTGDWTNRFPKEEFKEIKKLYSLYGAADRADALQWDLGHTYNQPMREAMYAFFDRWLKGQEYPNAVIESQVQTETVETLKSLDITPPGSRGVDPVYEYASKFHAKPPVLGSATEATAYLKRLRSGLAKLLGDVPVRGKMVGSPEPTSISGMRAEKLRVRSEPEIDVPAALFVPDRSGKHPLVVLLHPDGKRGLVEKNVDLVRKLTESGVAVLAPDVRLTGELAPTNEQMQWGWKVDGIMWGRPDVGMALTDLRACLDVLSERPDVDVSRTAIVGLGAAGRTALFAGALEPRASVVVCSELGPTYQDDKTYPEWKPVGWVGNIRRLADLPEIAAAVAPRRLIIAGTTSDFNFTSGCYNLLGCSQNATIGTESTPAEEVGQLLVKALAAPH